MLFAASPKQYFHNKTAVITGAGSGLGRSLAIELYRADTRLALCDLDTEGLKETQKLLNDFSERVSLHTVDVSDGEQMARFAEEAAAHHGQIDILINNAGITLTPTLFHEIPEDQFRKVIDVNMWGVYYGIKAFWPYLSTSPDARIVNVSSLAGLLGLYGYAPYAMSKMAVRALAETLQMEAVGTNISVLVVHPGGVRTNIIKNAPDLDVSSRENAHAVFTRAALLSSEAAAERIVKAIRKKQKRLVLGTDAKMVMTVRRLFPRSYPKILHAMFSQMTFKKI